MKYFKGVKTILLDCDGTLWFHRKDECKILSKALEIPLTEAFTNQYFYFLNQCYSYFKNKKVTIKKFTKLVSTCMPILTKYNISAKKFVETWFSVETSFVNGDSLELLYYLKARKYKIIVLSDMFYDKQVQLLEGYKIMPYIDDICTWDDTYMKKNPKSISRVIIPNHEDEYVIIGDSLKNDIAFAVNAGIRSIWYNPNCKKNGTNLIPTAEVRSLLEICKILQ